MYSIWLTPLALSVVLASACAPEVADTRMGTLRVALTSLRGEVAYQLNGATLRIDGRSTQEVSLDGPDDLNLSLPAGPYQLTLLQGWSLTTEVDGEHVPVAAQLLSENPVSLFMGAGIQEKLAYRFVLDDGTSVGSDEGSLEVGFVIVDAGAEEAPARSCVKGLRVNEVDYDQEGTDDAEFVEILQTAPCEASLEDVVLEFVNGSNGQPYHRVALDEAGSVGPLGYLVVGDARVLAALPRGVPAVSLPLAGMQNGPDSVVLRHAGERLDAFGYGEGAPFAETRGGPEDSGFGSLGRCPAGFDSEDNSFDFVAAPPSPGDRNGC